MGHFTAKARNKKMEDERVIYEIKGSLSMRGERF